MKEITNINKNWYFTLSAKNVPSSVSDDMQKIDLPHTWNGDDGQDGGNDYLRTKGYYLKELKKSDLKGEVNFIEFNGVNSSATIYWNGKELCTHHGGYSCFRVKIEKDVVKDTNILVVCADNTPNDFVYPQIADFTFYGGIYRDVNIISNSHKRFDLSYYGGSGLMVTPTIKGDDAIVEVKAFVSHPRGTKLNFKIYDGDKVVAEATKPYDDKPLEMTIENVHLWNGKKDPFLYKLVATLLTSDERIPLDEASTKFGCRSFKISGQNGFKLNGKSYPLRGVSRHQDYPHKGNALSYEDHKRDIDLIMEMGANTVRLAHYQHSQDFYDLCDEKGLIVWAEIPYISNHMPKGYDNTVSQMTELIVQNYNHPSIVVWGLSNEITMGGAADKSLLENHRKLNDLVHKMDPSRLTTMAVLSMCSPNEEITKISDVISYNHYFGWYGGTTDMNGKWFDDFHKKYPARAIGLSEYGCEALNWHTSNPEQGDYTEEYQAFYHEELIKQIEDRPYIWATHVWNMFDFAADARAEGGENGMNHKGLVTFDRQYKKDAFYAYKAWLSDEKVLHICGKRYVDRTEDVTKVTVYSNCKEVELYRNGELVEKKQKGKYPFFYFEVKNEGESILTAKADGLEDEAKINKVSEPNPDYTMQDSNDIINWFEISTPPGYFSINDNVGEIWGTFMGQVVLLRVGLKVKELMKAQNEEAEKPEQEKKKNSGMSFAGVKINKNLINTAKSFTVKRLILMAGNMFDKEFILELNSELNKIKKPKKKRK